MAEYIPCLDFCDGFWFFILLFKNRKGKIHSFWKRYSEKGKRLLLPYFCVMLTWVIPFYVHYSGFDLSKIVYKYVLGCAPSQLWFLPMLFLLFIIFYRVLNEKHVSTKGMLVVVAVSIGGGTCSIR